MGNTVRQLRGNDTFTIRHLTLLLVVGLLGFGWLGQQAFGQTTDGEEELFVLICVDSATGELRVAEDCADDEVPMTLASGAGLTEAFALIESVEVEQSDIVRVNAEQEEEIELLEDTVASAVAEIEEELVRQEAELERVEDTVASAVAEVEEQTIVIDDLATAVDGLETLTIDQATALEALEETVAGLTPPTVAFNATDNAPEGDFVLSAQITAPEKGILLMAGGVDASALSKKVFYRCRLLVDGEVVDGSQRHSLQDAKEIVLHPLADNWEEDCTTSGAREVEAGIHTVAFDLDATFVSGEGAQTNGNSSVWALWVPLDGS